MALEKVYGIETEWSIILPERDAQNMVADAKELNLFLQVMREFFNLKPSHSSSLWDTTTPQARKKLQKIIQKENIELENGYFLPNGARIYVDYPHLEYATPECRSIKDAIRTDKAGNRLIFKAAQKVSQRLGEKIAVRKNNCNLKGKTWGSHENYLITRKTFNELMTDTNVQNKLVPFRVVKQILCGAGKYRMAQGNHQQQKSVYQMSQRADFITKVMGASSTHDRPIIHTRDEPHADPQRFARLHDISGDANLCDWSLYFRLGLSGIILKMLEDDCIHDQPIIAYPVSALKAISKDISGKKTVTLTNENEMRAIDILRFYVTLAKQYVTHYKSTDEEKDVVEKCLWALNVYEQDPLLLAGYLDSPTKYTLIQEGKQRLHLLPEELELLDILYHDLDPRNSSHAPLVETGFIQRLVTDDEIDYFITNTVEDTRAYIRSYIITHWPNTIQDWEVFYMPVHERAKAHLTQKQYHAIISLLDNPLHGKEQSQVLFKKIQAHILKRKRR
ncbi:proteasome accessory factor PafA2 family protein [Patescibacteria group bacterium AH-259-L07]|nr:proteasome accessory factor PafA2 family protein [Patescibacteria group bacterium AH-259-L07]